jgi:hypothetical protein
MLIIAWINSVIPLIQAHKTRAALAQGTYDQRLELESVFEGQQQQEKGPTAGGGIKARLAWIVPLTVFGCIAALAVFAWIVSWLDQR